jgi:hypothetical protein
MDSFFFVQIFVQGTYWLIDGDAVTTARKKKKTALFTSYPNPKYFLFHLSHQIFRHMHGALNVDKKDN